VCSSSSNKLLFNLWRAFSLIFFTGVLACTFFSLLAQHSAKHRLFDQSWQPHPPRNGGRPPPCAQHSPRRETPFADSLLRNAARRAT
jgi:hypothetical protein